MPEGNPTIPQIKPNEKEQGASSTQGEDSILIPKLLNKEGEQSDLAKPKSDWKGKVGSFFGKIGSGRSVKILASLFVLLLIFALAIIIPSISVFKKAKVLYANGLKTKVAIEAQDLNVLKGKLATTRGSLEELQKSYKVLAWTKFIPFLGAYWRDGNHALTAAFHGLDAVDILVETITPYADIVGFTGGKAEEEGDGAKTAEERIDFLVQTIPSVIPKLDSLAQVTNKVKQEMDQINPNRYPANFRGIVLRENIRRVQELINQGASLVSDGKPLIEVAPYLLGIESERTYLVIFQNDKELRPTGGFLTAYSVMSVKEGKFEPVSSNDIYNLDAQYKPDTPAPEPIIKYLEGPYGLNKNLRLRDMNWTPDFAQSMEQFSRAVEEAGIKGIDGIIAVDTHLLVNLLEVLGPVGVPGFGNYSTQIVPECNCPQVIYELELFADVEGPIVWDPLDPTRIIYAPPNYENRKKIIGPLMNSILANAMGQPKEKLPDLFEAVFKSLTEKHVLFYLFDEEAQKAVESFGIAGRIDDYQGDYLHINDANLGGRKSNLYVTQEVDQQIEVEKDGSVVKTVTITYKNPEKFDGWLNSVLPNWVRIYVPKGSELLAFEGVEDKKEPYEEFGKTVFAGFFELRPEGVSKVTFKYKLPFKVDGEYNLFIQKQPGKDAPLYSLTLGKQEEEFFLRTDKELKFRI